MEKHIAEKETRIDPTESRRKNQPYGPRYFEASFSKLLSSNDINLKIHKWIKSRKCFMVYMGNSGSGKTYCCAALMNYHLKNKIYENERYWNERQLLGRIREDMEFGAYFDILKLLTDDELVIVDDIGSADYGDWGRKVMFDLIDLRYSQMKPTLFTTNLNEQGLKEQFGERAHSRLFDKINTHIEVRGKDLRLEELKKIEE